MERGPRVVLIVAMGHGRVIGRGNQLPWKLPQDLRRFKARTMGHPIVMGRRTWESLGRALPGRANVVVSARGTAAPEGVRVAASLEEGLAAEPSDEVFVIGGAQLYAAALPRAHEVEATLIDHPFEGDARFPPLGPEWHVAAREDFDAPDAAPPVRGSYVRLVRRAGRDACARCAPAPRDPFAARLRATLG